MADPDDTDARFRALIEAEYGGEPVGRTSVQPDVPELPEPSIVPVNELPTPRSWTPPDEDDEPFTPPPVAPMGPLSTPALLSLVLFGVAVVIGVAALARVVLPWWAPWAGLVCFVVSLGLAFSRLPNDRPPDSDNGAVV